MQRKFKIENGIVTDHRPINSDVEGFEVVEATDSKIIFNQMINTKSGTVKDGVLVVDMEKYNTALQESYAAKRAKEYHPIGDQLDSILKYLETKSDLTPELQTEINHWKSIKEKYPKDA
jgi:hypothetical protein